MSSPGNPRIRVRLSPAMQSIVAQAQGGGSEAAAMRALLLLGAAHAGLDLAGVAREIAQAQGELLNPAVITALRAVQDASGGGSHLAATWQPPGSHLAATPNDDRAVSDGGSDPFSVGIDV